MKNQLEMERAMASMGLTEILLLGDYVPLLIRPILRSEVNLN